jgi:2-oxo-4-hydroxy-4-carboxy-5-ureidoimidazoline decarboxylase
MVSQRPYLSRAQLMGEAERQWWRLFRGDWLEAFEDHPRIGSDVEALRQRFASTSDWAEGEQAGVQVASDETLQRLAQGNKDYEERFGYIFIVCATGKTADEMLGLLSGRMQNPPEQELFIAAGEQARITRLRLEKLV